MNDPGPRNGRLLGFASLLGLAVVLTFEATRWFLAPGASTDAAGRPGAERPISSLGHPPGLRSAPQARPPTTLGTVRSLQDDRLRRVSRPVERAVLNEEQVPDLVPPPPTPGIADGLAPPAPPPDAAGGLPEALEPLSPSEPGDDELVTLRAEDEDVRRVLGLLGQQASVNILVSPAVAGRVRVNLEDVPFRQALDVVLKLANLGARREGRLIYVYTRAELTDIRSREQRPMIRVYHLNYVRALDLQTMVQPFLSDAGTITTTPPSQQGLGAGTAAGQAGNSQGAQMVGGGAGAIAPGVAGPAAASAGGAIAGAVDTGGNSLASHDVVVIRDYPENLAVIDEIVKRLDVQPPQVLIEAVIMSVELRDTQHLGVNFSVVDNLERLALVSGSAGAINAAAGFPPSTVLTTAGKLVAGYTAIPDQGLRFGFISSNVSGFIRALEAINKTNILASPRILVLNKQRAEIQLGQRLGYRNTVTNLTSSLQTVDFLSVGTLLSIRPYVSTDGMVRMEIHPEKSTGRLDEQGVPQTNTSELTTNILVPDGATIVIGGLIDDQDDVVQDGLPGLGRLKYFGALFRNRTTATRKTELIVLLTPRVLRQDGLPEPVPGIAPSGPMKIPNSGPMPGPPLYCLPNDGLVPLGEPPDVPRLMDPGSLAPRLDEIVPPRGFTTPSDERPNVLPPPSDAVVRPVAAEGTKPAPTAPPPATPQRDGYRPGDFTRALTRRLRADAPVKVR